MEPRTQATHWNRGAFHSPASLATLACMLVGMLATCRVHAGVVFHATSGEFQQAVTGLRFMGSENWSSAGNAAARNLTDPLSPGVAKTPFANGTSAASGIRVQSNSLKNAPVAVSPGNGLFYAPTGFAGLSGNIQPSNQLSAQRNDDSFDIVFSTVNGVLPRAVSLSPMYYKITGADAATVTVRVYNQANTLLGTTTVTNVKDCLEDAFLGIVTTGNDALLRVNLWATTTDVVGADNIAVHGSTTTGPRLRAAGITGQGFTAWLDADSGKSYRVLASTNATTWQAVQTNTLVSPSQLLTFPISGPVRFFQAQQLP